MDSSIILRIDDLARGGAGVSRDSEGRVIFVPHTAPGDRVRVRIIEEEKRYAQAELIEILEPSGQRIDPKCPVFGKCGGCQWQHLPYALQWKTKLNGVIHALKRVQIEPPGAGGQIEEIPADQIWNYRNRVQLRGEGNQIGFFQPGSRSLVPIERCDIAHPLINDALSQTREEGAKRSRAYKVEIEVLPSGELRKTWNARHSAHGFRQVHDEQNDRMKAWIAQSLAPADRLYDLFGGSGNLSFPLSPVMGEVHCIDLGSPSGRGSDQPSHFHFHRSGVSEWLEKNSRIHHAATSSAVAILDPPREGLGRDFTPIAQGVEALGVSQLVMVGCDPDSWARDLSRWVKRGWIFEKMMVIDLFPQTPHVESLGVLSRSSTSS